MEALWLLLYRLSPLRTHGNLFVALMTAIFIVCIWSFFRCPIPEGNGALWVLGFALLFRSIQVLRNRADTSTESVDRQQAGSRGHPIFGVTLFVESGVIRTGSRDRPQAWDGERRLHGGGMRTRDATAANWRDRQAGWDLGARPPHAGAGGTGCCA